MSRKRKSAVVKHPQHLPLYTTISKLHHWLRNAAGALFMSIDMNVGKILIWMYLYYSCHRTNSLCFILVVGLMFNLMCELGAKCTKASTEENEWGSAVKAVHTTQKYQQGHYQQPELRLPVLAEHTGNGTSLLPPGSPPANTQPWTPAHLPPEPWSATQQRTPPFNHGVG